MGAQGSGDPIARSAWVARGSGRRFPAWLGILIISPLIALIGILVVVAAAMIVYLVAFAAFIILIVVAGPLHELLRGLAGR